MPQSAICSRKPSGTVPRSSPITTQRCATLSCAVAASKAHRGTQHFAEWRKRRHEKAGGVEARKPPVRAGGIERIRRRADGEMARNRRLFVPGVEAIRLHADRDIEIKAYL